MYCNTQAVTSGWRGGWAYNTWWAYNTYSTVVYICAIPCTSLHWSSTKPEKILTSVAYWTVSNSWWTTTTIWEWCKLILSFPMLYTAQFANACISSEQWEHWDESTGWTVSALVQLLDEHYSALEWEQVHWKDSKKTGENTVRRARVLRWEMRDENEGTGIRVYCITKCGSAVWIRRYASIRSARVFYVSIIAREDYECPYTVKNG